MTTWARRTVTIPGFFVAAGLYWLSLPLLLAVALLSDLSGRRRWTMVRTVIVLACYTVVEAGGIIACFVSWLLSGRLTGGSSARDRRWSYRIQLWYNEAIYRTVEYAFHMRTLVEGAECLDRGPLVVLSRHVSLGDAFLPAVLLSGRYDLRLRYVVKRELLWVPFLDIIGQRLPNSFVRRDSKDSAAEIAAVQSLLIGLGSREAVIIYPEGTRFTPAKRECILAKLELNKDRRYLDNARALRHVLPPRLGGPLGLLEGNSADVVFFAHSGFEGINSVFDLVHGTLLDATIRVQFWRVPLGDIPRDRDARAAWLHAQWQTMDDWIDRQIAASRRPACQPAPVTA